jgi:hypothetical protein
MFYRQHGELQVVDKILLTIIRYGVEAGFHACF